MNHPHDFDKDLCSYLYYWIGDKIYSNSSNKGVFTKLITMFFDVLNSKHLSYICGTLKTGIDKDTFKNNKLLFDYSKNHENIKLDTVYGDATCDKKYKDSLQNYIKIYKDAYSNCTGNSEKKYECDKYSEIWDEELYQKLSTFSCIHSENGRAVLELQEAYEQQQPAQVQNYIQDSATLPSPHRIPARDEDLVKNQHTRGQTFPRAYEPIQLDDATESGTSKTIAGSVAPVLGVSSISLLLYKVIENTIDIHTFIIYICFLFFK
ncbi:hypothetical protein PVNG_05804 [Plasmodium vivax North Korean]|uniref:Variable surface protein Vir7-like protein n=1 Tax=Plasmodium vivax North Korean TaxID=1035514 RepID=A0A0J9W6H7_PLAVI|nr:hypothetical protein PVNG_05804 [Plasmodium vivax North Korean]